jgi:hypothetical protein
MGRSWVCEGSNENCRFCRGLGTVPDALATARDRRVQRLATEASSGTKKVRHRSISHRVSPLRNVSSAPQSRILLSYLEGCRGRCSQIITSPRLIQSETKTATLSATLTVHARRNVSNVFALIAGSFCGAVVRHVQPLKKRPLPKI